MLDPACGTAGFLISAWNHVLNANIDGQGASTLTPDERERLARNFTGYDISPDMVRLSLVNMYLHGFANPRILEYDTLTSEDHWHYHADVVLANPPFMNPKGGIRPHKRFSVQSTRSEVLFVDYMAEHLTPNGRAGIIVPEGIIFQSQRAHTQLRKMLVENYLVAVVSLPAGVFKPYSGVKTSVLILDKALARHTKHIAFFKVEHDGYDLGDQRRPIETNDLPNVQAEVAEYLRRARAGGGLDGYEPEVGFFVEKMKVADNGDYNLSAERYKGKDERSTKWPTVRLGSVLNRSEETINPAALRGSVNYVGLENISQGSGHLVGDVSIDSPEQIKSLKNVFRSGDILYGKLRPNLNKVWLANRGGICSTDIFVLRPLEQSALSSLYSFILRSKSFNSQVMNYLTGAQLPRVTWDSFVGLSIPLPPLDVQREIVAEVEGYQRVIDGARAVLDGYRPQVPVDPSWPLVRLGDTEIFDIQSGGTPKSDVEEYWDGGVPWITLMDLPADEFISEIHATQRTISELGLRKSSAKMIPANSVVISSRATIGRIGIVRTSLATNQGFRSIIIRNSKCAIPEYIALSLKPLVPIMDAWATGGTFKEISKAKFCELEVPLPPLEVQQAIVAELQAEQALVEANRELITRMEARIEAAIGRVWGEG